MFHSLPLEPRTLEATEARLEAIYAAAKMGLRGDSLALAAGLLPIEYRRLAQFDPLVELAEQKGRADAEEAMSKVLYTAAMEGDAKAALDILKHQHGWVAKQAIEVSIDQQISIIGALEKAEQRVIEGVFNEVTSLKGETDAKETDTKLLHPASERFDAGRDERNSISSK